MRASPAAPPPWSGKRRRRTCRSSSSPAGLAGIGHLHSAGPPQRGGGQLTLPVGGPRRLSHAPSFGSPTAFDAFSLLVPHHHLPSSSSFQLPPICWGLATRFWHRLRNGRRQGANAGRCRYRYRRSSFRELQRCLQWSLLRCGRHCTHGMPRLFCCSHLVLSMCWSESRPSIFCPFYSLFLAAEIQKFVLYMKEERMLRQS